MIKVQDGLGEREVAASEVFQPIPRIAERQLLLGVVPTDLRRLTPQLEPQFIQPIARLTQP